MDTTVELILLPQHDPNLPYLLRRLNNCADRRMRKLHQLLHPLTHLYSSLSPKAITTSLQLSMTLIAARFMSSKAGTSLGFSNP